MYPLSSSIANQHIKNEKDPVRSGLSLLNKPIQWDKSVVYKPGNLIRKTIFCQFYRASGGQILHDRVNLTRVGLGSSKTVIRMMFQISFRDERKQSLPGQYNVLTFICASFRCRVSDIVSLLYAFRTESLPFTPIDGLRYSSTESVAITPQRTS